MRESLRLGRIAGIDVGINWSVLVIFGLLTFGLAAGRFPITHPGLDPVTYLLAGLVAGVVFFASLLAHELGHALVARRNGMGVDGITLWLFGGVARLTGETPSPGAELRIAGVGPLISIGLAGGFLVGAVSLASFAAPGILVGVVSWLALINFLLAAFNSIPAAPLDGGRILRAFLWWRHGDRQRAAVSAANAGRVFGGLLVGVGALLLLSVPGLGGVWIMLIGWFIIRAAGAEADQARVQTALADVRVADVMAPDPIGVAPGMSVEEVLERYVLGQRVTTFPLVAPDGQPAGLVTLNQLKSVPAIRRSATAVEQVACSLSEVALAAPGEPLTDLLPRLFECSENHAIVVDEGRVVGIVSPSDVARQLELSELRRERAAAGRV